ncbi:hypothetical protein QOZ80_5AG0398630 [Eleusine coracana subsp. coracana]|nr:hypothetical protein QOZ80_5AG0398630 [Eleusine coracana subsp. coracana]
MDQPWFERHGLAVFLGGMGMYHRGIEIELCVYDPMAADTTKQCRFLPGPPPTISQIREHAHFYDKFVLLTPADDDGVVVTSGCCSFLILAFDFTGLNECSRSVMVRTFSSDAWRWSPATLIRQSPPLNLYFDSQPTSGPVVVSGGFIELPSEVISASKGSYQKLHLTSSSPSTNGRLCLIEAHRLKVSVYWLLPPPPGGGTAAGCWELHAVIDTERTVHSIAEACQLRPLLSKWPTQFGFISSWARSGAVFLLPSGNCNVLSNTDYGDGILLDLETKEMRAVNKKMDTFLYEVDLASRLLAMKTF